MLARRIMGALSSDSRVATSEVYDDGEFYLRLATEWADAHPRGRVCIVGRKRAVDRIFERFNGPEHRLLLLSFLQKLGPVPELTRHAVAYGPESTLIAGLRLTPKTKLHQLPRASSDQDLWILTECPRPAQFEPLVERTGVGGARLVVLGCNSTRLLPDYPREWDYLLG